MNHVLSIALVAAGLVAAGLLRADDAPDQAAIAEGKLRLAFMQKSADEYRVQLERAKAPDVTRLSDPVLRWNNQVVQEDDAALFLWVCDKRPVCGAQLFLQGDHWHHEFQSLAAEPFSVRWRKDAWQWSCQRTGLSLTPADLDAPAASAPQRLRQMRSFADRFTAAIDPSRTDQWQDPHQLRLLTTPVYRYANEREILDGALFAFAQGTNPEVLLLIEAPRGEGARQWRYGFAPMTSFEARVWQGDKLVWQQATAPVPTKDKQGPYQFRWAAVPRSQSK